EGGRLVLPLGSAPGCQDLWLLEKRGGRIYRTNYGGVLFVPLTRARPAKPSDGASDEECR
ncbi:MAG: hypothetical protein ACP5SI_03725, partial [Chloroflexia bacterium]